MSKVTKTFSLDTRVSDILRELATLHPKSGKTMSSVVEDLVISRSLEHLHDKRHQFYRIRQLAKTLTDQTTMNLGTSKGE